MRRLLGTTLKVIAGCLFYIVCMLAFVRGPSAAAKWGLVAVFLVPALAALAGGLALSRFQQWRRDTGIVLLGAAALTAFIALTMACILMTPELQVLMGPDTPALFGDHTAGAAILGGLALAGVALMPRH